MSFFLRKVRAEAEGRVGSAKRSMPLEALKESPLYGRKPQDARAAFRDGGYNIIAEIKFASPSEGSIHPGGDPVAIAQSYLGAGACMLSILTEPAYFKGDLAYIAQVRKAQPRAFILRKDFIVDAYQIAEARAAGADAVLLIMAMTGRDLARALHGAAVAEGLSPLVEVHDEAELDDALAIGADFIGVNNRNLDTLKTDLGTGRRLAKRKPKGAVFICESGLSSANDLMEMKSLGYDGFLMGTHFMRRDNPGAALMELKEQLRCA